MILTKEMLLAKECASRDPNRGTINQLKVENNTAISTNGRILMEIENCNEGFTDEQFPIIENITPRTESTLLSLAEIDKIQKSMVKKPSIPILETALLGNNNDNVAHIAIPDLENPITIKCAQDNKLNFSDINLFKNMLTTDIVYDISLTPAEMQHILDVAKKVRSESIHFTFRLDTSDNIPAPVQFEIQNEVNHKITGILMGRRRSQDQT